MLGWCVPLGCPPCLLVCERVAVISQKSSESISRTLEVYFTDLFYPFTRSARGPRADLGSTRLPRVISCQIFTLPIRDWTRVEDEVKSLCLFYKKNSFGGGAQCS